MATIRKRGLYQWEAQIRRRGYPAQSKTFETKPEAQAWAQMIESEMARGIWLSRSEAESTTLRELLDRYQTEIVPTKRGRAQELSVIRALQQLDIAPRSVASIRGADLARLRDGWLKTYEPATVSRRLCLLSHLFNVARREWGMESLSNPVELIRKPTVNNARTRRVSATSAGAAQASTTEVDRIIAATDSAFLPAFVRLGVETAMRRSEIAGLRWEHIDTHRRVAHLPLTKNGSARDVPLSKAAVAVLEDLRNRLPQRDGQEPARGLVFPIRPDAITRAFERAVARARKQYEFECAKAGFPADPSFLTDICFHDLRHEAASRLANIYQLHELAKITGHKDPRMLMRYYHPKAEDLAKRLD